MPLWSSLKAANSTLTSDNNGRPFCATVTVDDEATAVNICKKWRNAASKASGELIKLILGE